MAFSGYQCGCPVSSTLHYSIVDLQIQKFELGFMFGLFYGSFLNCVMG